MHHATNPPWFSLVLWWPHSGPTTFESSTLSHTEATVSTSPQVIPARLLHHLTRMLQNSDKQMKSVQRRYKAYHDKKIYEAPQTLYAGQYVYFDRLSTTTPAPERLATDPYSKKCPQTWPIQSGRSFAKHSIYWWARGMKSCFDRPHSVGPNTNHHSKRNERCPQRPEREITDQRDATKRTSETSAGRHG